MSEESEEMRLAPTFFDYVLEVTLRNEGGLLETEAAAKVGDPGGETYKGITAATLERLGIEGNPRDLTDDMVREIYRLNYWAIKNGPRAIVPTSPSVALAVFDAGVQHGPRRAIRWLQEVIDANPDGLAGPKTCDAIPVMGEACVIVRYHEIRRVHVCQWVECDVARLPLLTGLISRIDLMERTALATLVEEMGHHELREEFRYDGLTRA